MVLIAIVSLLTPAVSLDDVYARVSRFKGVRIAAEMVKPSTINMEFRIARGGRMWAKYPTTEMFIGLKEQTTWMPDRRQFDTSPVEPGNPVPAGFEPLWPKGDRLKPLGKAVAASFAGKPALKIPCRAAGGHDVTLFVNPKTLIPVGTIASAGGTTFESHYKSVTEQPYTLQSLTFRKPKDAVRATNEDPSAKLIKPGSPIKDFNGRTIFGGAVSSAKLRKQFPKGLVINFWFSACTGCIQEMPYFRKSAGGWKAKGIGVLGVNPIDPASSASKTSKTNSLPYDTLTGDVAASLAKQLGVMAYPVTVVVDPNGKVVDSMMGFDEKRLVAALRKL